MAASALSVLSGHGGSSGVKRCTRDVMSNGQEINPRNGGCRNAACGEPKGTYRGPVSGDYFFSRCSV